MLATLRLHSGLIIRRGTCTFVQKLNNVAARGAKYALIYKNGVVRSLATDRCACTRLTLCADFRHPFDQSLCFYADQ